MNAARSVARLAARVIALAALSLASTLAPAQPRPAGEQGFIAESPEFQGRLASLAPSSPAAYLDLGEEILALGRSEEDRQLARTLLTIAYDLARQAGDQPGVQASACIALADTARFERDRRWLWSIARLIDPRFGRPDWSRTVERSVSDESAFRAATVLGLLRAGEGPRAKELLRDESVRGVFTWYSGLLTGTGPGNVLATLDEQADRWPCPECRNRRVVRGPGEGAQTRCHSCRGTPGWALGEPGLLATLRFESRVLSGVQRSWGAQLAADLAEPLRDPDPAAVAGAMGVDTSRVLFRDGAWVAP